MLHYSKIIDDINEDTAYFHSSMYKEIMGELRRSSCIRDKRLAIVKISAGGYSIYRKFSSISKSGFNGDSVALTYSSIRMLTDKSVSALLGGKVTVSKSNRHLFFWNHPFHATRVSYRLGLVSIVLGLLSIGISLIF